MKPTYEPHDIEARWYDIWEQSGAFRPEVNPDGDPFTIVIPPPNVTGVLHMGHALNNSMQDVIIRRKRMQGYAALWLPGMDHAGIATQNVVERELAEEGLTRHDLGRERFVEQVWAWKAKSGGLITKQLRALGTSCDWSRERFTLDEGLSRAVREVFVSLYEAGLIYRGNRIINWCPRCHTALSDIEVEHEDEVGQLASISYPLTDGSGEIVVATTRPETMLGDSGVAVHPDDERYRDVVGKTVTLPLMGRQIPIVADDAVDIDFGTGAVKVTPAHDAVDFEIGERHGLEPIVVIDTDAKITEAGGRFAGMDRFEARKAVLEALEAEGRLVDLVEHHHSVGHCSRCDSVVEPLLSLQWFVKVAPLVGPAIEAVRDGSIRFVPKRWENNYFHWMENLRDWTISRQLWWGHRIPAWYCDNGHGTIVSREDVTGCPECGGSVTPDEDVLDTWFSSALWPFSTLGWPDETEDLGNFYPTSALVTGFDIISFWVARMIMMGLRFMGERPFDDVVIHGLVRDVDGRKMSKSLGNAMDPLDLIDKYGADASRLALIQSAAPGHDIPLNEDWIDAARRFGNKLWNAVRFAVEHAGIADVPPDGGYPDDPDPVAAWILGRLAEVTAQYDQMMDEYRFSDAVGLLYNFAWSEAFDWYIEMSKPMLRDVARGPATKQTLGVVLRDILKLFHPVIPFVTEELWSELVGDGLIMTSMWPSPPATDVPPGIDELQKLVAGIRRFRSDHQLGNDTLPLVISDPEGLSAPWWSEQLSALGAVDTSFQRGSEARAGHTRIMAGSIDGFIPLAGIVDVDEERRRLAGAIEQTEVLLNGSNIKLANPNFRDRAPSDIVAKEESKVADFEARLTRLREQLAELG